MCVVKWFLQRSVSEKVASTGRMNGEWYFEKDFKERAPAAILLLSFNYPETTKENHEKPQINKYRKRRSNREPPDMCLQIYHYINLLGVHIRADTREA